MTGAPTREALIAAATVLHDEECRSCDRKYRMSCPNMANAILRSGPAATVMSEDAPEFGDRFTVIPDSGVIELHCGSHSPEARTWKVGYHPSLDVLVEQARAHNAAEHAAPPQVTEDER